jgi:class 3 adenylate cyclase
MSFWTELSVPIEKELLVGFYDLVGYGRYAEKAEPLQLLATMSGYFALTGRILENAGGRLFKTIGDAGLAAFPAELVDAGVLAFQAVQREGNNWLVNNGLKSRAIVKLHQGPVAIGLVGSPGEEILDLYGKTVNIAATLPSTGLATTPAVFRRLSAGNRKSFKKHTPPISYIDAADPRPGALMVLNH